MSSLSSRVGFGLFPFHSPSSTSAENRAEMSHLAEQPPVIRKGRSRTMAQSLSLASHIREEYALEEFSDATTSTPASTSNSTRNNSNSRYYSTFTGISAFKPLRASVHVDGQYSRPDSDVDALTDLPLPPTPPPRGTRSRPTLFQFESTGFSGSSSASFSLGSSASLESKRFQKLEKAKIDYEYYLGLAQQKDFSGLDALNVINVTGVDSYGRVIVVIMLRNLPAKEIDTDYLFLYFIKVLDPLVENEYNLVLVNTKTTNQNLPTFSWLRKVYRIFNRKYKKNLKGLYIIHPNFWIKLMFRLFKPFISAKFWKKLVYVDDVFDLFQHLDREQVNLPDDIFSYNTTITKARPMFGGKLQDIMAHTHSKTGLPIVVEKCVEYLLQRALKVEGIFRLSGSSAHIEELKQAFNQGEDVNLSMCEDPHAVACILKSFLRELQEPVVPCEFFDTCIKIEMEFKTDLSVWLDAVKQLLNSLPPPNKLLLSHIFSLLGAVADHSSFNKMTPPNLAKMFGPNLIRTLTESPHEAMRHTLLVNQFVCRMIENQREIFSALDLKANSAATK